MTTAFIIAGFDLKATAASDRYIALENGLRDKGYDVVASDITWKRKTPSQYASGFVKFYNKHKSDKNIIIGNSFGAVVAFITADETKPDELYLCSLSPFFKEDRSERPDNYGIGLFGKRRMEDLWSISAELTADQINKTRIKTTITYGEKELETSPILVARCKKTAKHILGSRIVELPNAPHDMANKTYSLSLLDCITEAK